MLGFGQPPFGAQMVQGAGGFPPAVMPSAQPNMAPQMPQMQRMPTMMGAPQIPPTPMQSHDNGLLQMLLGPGMNGQNGHALGLLKMLAQMQQQPAPTTPPNPYAMGAAQGLQPPAGFGQMPQGFGQVPPLAFGQQQ